MSKTYTRDERRKKNIYRRANRRKTPVDFTRRSNQPDVITPEWAVGTMSDHVDYLLFQMVEDGEAKLEDTGDYRSIINRRICLSLRSYDPNVASIRNYLTNVIGREMLHIYRMMAMYRRYCRIVQLRPIVPLSDDKEGIPENSLSDGCRSIRQLELRMDVDVLGRMLWPLERKVLLMRIEGLTLDEIVAELGITMYAARQIVANIQKKAIECGFEPLKPRKRDAQEEDAKKI